MGSARTALSSRCARIGRDCAPGPAIVPRMCARHRTSPDLTRSRPCPAGWAAVHDPRALSAERADIPDLHGTGTGAQGRTHRDVSTGTRASARYLSALNARIGRAALPPRRLPHAHPVATHGRGCGVRGRVQPEDRPVCPGRSAAIPRPPSIACSRRSTRTPSRMACIAGQDTGTGARLPIMEAGQGPGRRRHAHPCRQSHRRGAL